MASIVKVSIRRRSEETVNLKKSDNRQFAIISSLDKGICVGMRYLVQYKMPVGVCVCVFFPFILDIKFVGRTSRGHTGGRSHRTSHPPSFCGAERKELGI